MPRVFNTRLRKRQGATELLGPNDAKALGIPFPSPGSFTSRKLAEKVHRRMQDVVEEWVPFDKRPLTIAQWVQRWLEEYPRRRGTTNTNNALMLKPLVAEYGVWEMRDFGREQARAFALEHRAHSRVAKVLFNDAIYEAELPGVERNPFDRLKLPSSEPRKVALTHTELDRLVACAPDTPWGRTIKAMIVFAAYTGLRLGELCAMEWDWISDGRIEVRRQIDKSGRTAATKNGEGDTPDAKRPPEWVSIPDPAMSALEGLPRSLSGLVFVSPKGRLVMPWSVGHHWRPIRDKFLSLEHEPRRRRELDGMVWHALRHTCSTLMIQAGCSRWEVAMQLRHSNPSLVDSTYTHIDRQGALESIARAMSRKVTDTTTDTKAENDR